VPSEQSEEAKVELAMATQLFGTLFNPPIELEADADDALIAQIMELR
jgi:hypothetical protein